MIPFNPERIRLIVTDMDGTLLDGEKRLPPDFPASVTALKARGIRWAIASGRQLANLSRLFEGIGLRPDIIAENGALALAGGEETPFFRDLTPVSTFEAIITAAQSVPHATTVLCGEQCAWAADNYPRNFPQVSHYFAVLEPWHRLEEVMHRAVCKVAIYHPRAATELLPVLAPLETSDLRVILSSPTWIDVQPGRINKGRALTELLKHHALAPDQAIVFGDYLNDREMMTVGAHAVAMENAHPDLKALCPLRAPANTENGVMVYLQKNGILQK